MSQPRPKARVKRLPTFEGYECLKELGEGNSGTVYLAKSTGSSKEKVAIKVLQRSSRLDAKNDEEINKLKTNQHQHIVKFVNSFDDNTSTLLIMEYCPMSLQEKIDEARKSGGCLSLDDVYKMMNGILQAIVHLHDKRLVYGDLKPANILLSESGIAKLGDFGGVREMSGTKTFVPAEMGTIKYWSPEMFETNAVPSFKSDMWAFGIILLELLTNTVWINGNEMHRIRDNILSLNLKVATTDLSADQSTLLGLLLDRDPSQRISAKDLADSGRLTCLLGLSSSMGHHLVKENAQLQSKLQTREKEISSLKKEVTRLKRELSQKSTEANDSHLEEVKMLMEQCKINDVTIAKQDEKIAVLESQNSKLHDQLRQERSTKEDASKDTIAMLMEQGRMNDAKIEKLEKELSQSRKQLMTHRDQHTETERTLNDTQRALGIQREKNTELSTQLARSQRETNELRQKVNQLAGQLEEAKSDTRRSYEQRSQRTQHPILVNLLDFLSD
ncbi:putative serine/threonine protein kinase [Blattamonas nauphoetae]|uniref:Serine/threonine protein kinase n=1 Tax=Blattamonas nauphoetae TaxID=2049346 RepID=A0ABQ9Y0K1_9EUKA|nr:putative serine/threonine protein kinase [Blattamonas nauphoetae]